MENPNPYKPLYNDHWEEPIARGRELQEEVGKLLKPIYHKACAEGYQLRDLTSLLFSELLCLEAETLQTRNMRLAMKLRKELNV